MRREATPLAGITAESPFTELAQGGRRRNPSAQTFRKPYDACRNFASLRIRVRLAPNRSWKYVLDRLASRASPHRAYKLRYQPGGCGADLRFHLKNELGRHMIRRSFVNVNRSENADSLQR
jgi:hypothetical protein